MFFQYIMPYLALLRFLVPLCMHASSTVGKKEKMGACYPEYASSNTLTADLLFKAKARAIADVVVETPTGLGSKFLFLSKPFVDFVKIG